MNKFTAMEKKRHQLPRGHAYMEVYYEDLQQAIKDIAWHEEHLKKEQAVNSERQSWIDALNTTLEGIE